MNFFRSKLFWTASKLVWTHPYWFWTDVKNIFTILNHIQNFWSCSKQFGNILSGHEIRVCVDHKNLARTDFDTERIMHWRSSIEEFGPKLIFTKGECLLLPSFGQGTCLLLCSCHSGPKATQWTLWPRGTQRWCLPIVLFTFTGASTSWWIPSVQTQMVLHAPIAQVSWGAWEPWPHLCQFLCCHTGTFTETSEYLWYFIFFPFQNAEWCCCLVALFSVF